MAAGVPVADAAAQAEVDAQFRSLTELHPVTAEEFRAMGRACVRQPEWRAAYEAIAPGLAEYQQAAIELYAAGLPA